MSFIVVGVDGSEAAYAALVAATEQARHIQAEVRAIGVVTLPAVSGYEYGPIDVQAMEDAAERTIASALDRLNGHYDQKLPVAISSEVRIGHVGTELMRATEADDGASMIVAGSRGFGGFKSMMLGSTTTFLSHHLTCPLLIIPSDQG